MRCAGTPQPENKGPWPQDADPTCPRWAARRSGRRRLFAPQRCGHAPGRGRRTRSRKPETLEDARRRNPQQAHRRVRWRSDPHAQRGQHPGKRWIVHHGASARAAPGGRRLSVHLVLCSRQTPELPSLTLPVARNALSNSHSSASNPPSGYDHAGALSRAMKRQVRSRSEAATLPLGAA